MTIEFEPCVEDFYSFEEIPEGSLLILLQVGFAGCLSIALLLGMISLIRHQCFCRAWRNVLCVVAGVPIFFTILDRLRQYLITMANSTILMLSISQMEQKWRESITLQNSLLLGIMFSVAGFFASLECHLKYVSLHLEKTPVKTSSKTTGSL